MIIQVLKYSVLCDCAVGGREISSAPKLAPPILFFEFRELALQLVRRTALHLADQMYPSAGGAVYFPLPMNVSIFPPGHWK